MIDKKAFGLALINPSYYNERGEKIYSERRIALFCDKKPYNSISEGDLTREESFRTILDFSKIERYV